MKRISALLLTASLFFTIPLFASASAVAAVDPVASPASAYSVLVSDSRLHLRKNGATTAAYEMRAPNLVLLTDQSDDLMICFYNPKDQFVGVSLGRQSAVTVSGAVGILTLGEELDRSVTIDSFCRVDQLDVNAPVSVTIGGTVDELCVNSDATVTATAGATVQTALITDFDADFNQNIGSSVGYTDQTAAVSSAKGIRLYTDPIYAFYGDELGDISWALEDNVRAYRDNKRISGDVEWAVSESKTLKKDGSYRFVFLADNESYGKVYGTIRVVVVEEEADEDYDLDITPIEISSTSKRLSDLTSKLKKNVKVYNEDGKKISGTLVWASENQRVRETDTYDFIFIPSSSKYDSIRGEIEIIVNDD